jgi:penicillin-binding protein 2
MIVFVSMVHMVLAYRFFQLQILDFEFYNKRADSNRIRVMSLPAPRGLILDRHGEIIVYNYPTYILYGIDVEIKDKQKNYEVISRTIGIDTSSLKKNYNNYYRNRFLPTRLAKDLNIKQLSRLEEAKNELSGIIYKQYPERIYNPKIRASHVLGYLKEMDQEIARKRVLNGDYEFGDLVGRSGLERKYETILRGKKGVEYYQVDAYGREVGKLEVEQNILPYPGNNISTTLDVSLQQLIEKEFIGKKGVGIVSNPKTGGLLAYVSAPDYKPDLFTGLVTNSDWQEVIADTNRPLLNRVANGTYPPASIFKMIVAIALLENKLISTNMEVFCTGSYEFYDRTFGCWSEFGHGKIDLEQAIVQSCDVFFYKAIQKIKLDELAGVARQFGIGFETGIDLPAEMKGRMPDNAYMDHLYGRWGWSKGALLNISIGQGEILVTPLQIAAYINILATRGKTHPLHLVQPKDEFIQAPKVSSKSWDFIQKSMRKVIIEPKGTGRSSDPKIAGLKIFGKTGTAENPHGEPHAWFIAFGEKDGSMISVVILVENGGHGGEVAAPMARKIFKQYFDGSRSKFAKY